MYGKETLLLAKKAISLIETEKLSKNQAEEIVRDSLINFDNYINPAIFSERRGKVPLKGFIEWEESGTAVFNINGDEIIDCVGGYGVFLLGHSHPRVVKCVQAQLNRRALQSQEMVDPLRGYLARLIAEITPGDLRYSCFFTSGSEAVEMALKLARLSTGKTSFISTINGFHGQTFGALSATGRESLREPFYPLLPNFYHVKYGDIKAMEEQLIKLEKEAMPAAAVIIEPVQGEGGIHLPPAGYFKDLRDICDSFGTLLIADETQTGMGRTGKMFGIDNYNVVPDIMTLGKALGGGVVPLSAVVARPEHWERMKNSLTILTSSTFGGNPLSCAGAIAAITVTLEDDIPSLAALKGKYFLDKLQTLQKKYPQVLIEARGLGLMLGLEVISVEFGCELENRLLADGILIGGPEIGTGVIRFLPPVTITLDQIERVIAVMEKHIVETLKEAGEDKEWKDQ